MFKREYFKYIASAVSNCVWGWLCHCIKTWSQNITMLLYVIANQISVATLVVKTASDSKAPLPSPLSMKVCLTYCTCSAKK